ncbi:MAG: dprA, partial [Geminicoccaceae bacterium]|nr:dprA [Geminicoccaceae bacterium]
MVPVDEERAAYLALTQVAGMGPARLHTLLSTFKTALGARSAPFAVLRSLPGFSAAAATALRATSLESGRKTAEAALSLGAEVLLPSDSSYPVLLRNIPDPPPVLFALGNTTLLLRPSAAIVGSRDHTGYGAGVCRALSAAAAESGVVVVSGMARGLDAVAHTAALDAAGGTIGVLGNGLGVVYPAANRALYDRVA